MKLWLIKFGKLDECIRPLFANSVTYVTYWMPHTFEFCITRFNIMGIQDYEYSSDVSLLVEMAVLINSVHCGYYRTGTNLILQYNIHNCVG